MLVLNYVFKATHCLPKKVILNLCRNYMNVHFYVSLSDAVVQCNACFTLDAQAVRRQRRSCAYAKREQHVPVVLSHWPRLLHGAEPRLVYCKYRRVSSDLSPFPVFWCGVRCLTCALIYDRQHTLLRCGSISLYPTYKCI